jgi:hypothetical protein
MTERNAAGRKTEPHDGPITNELVAMLVCIGPTVREALARADGKEVVDKYDSRGRIRDHEIAVAARMGSVSAQLVNALVKVEALNDRRLENCEK